MGPGANEDAGWEAGRLDIKRAMLVTDPGVAALGHPEHGCQLIQGEGIDVVLYDRTRLQPTRDSCQQAADFALDHEVDGFVSVAGASSMDTAKVANLICSHPVPVMDYVNPPAGEGRKPPSPLQPHLAIPTTSGTGSVRDPDDVEARGFMMLTATVAGVGFGSAGVHIPHSGAYPNAGLKHDYQPPGYPDDHPFVPHGQPVIITAPATFRVTYDAMPERHHRVAQLLSGEEIREAAPDTLPDVLRPSCRDVDAPRRVGVLGYGEDDIPALVDGALKQRRLLDVAPKEVGEDALPTSSRLR